MKRQYDETDELVVKKYELIDAIAERVGMNEVDLSFRIDVFGGGLFGIPEWENHLKKHPGDIVLQEQLHTLLEHLDQLDFVSDDPDATVGDVVRVVDLSNTSTTKH